LEKQAGRLRKNFSKRWIRLTAHLLQVCRTNDLKSVKLELPIGEITFISLDESSGKDNAGFTVYSAGKSLSLRASSRSEMFLWVIALDSLHSRSHRSGVVDVITKVSIMERLFKADHAGGVLKGSLGDEWQYFSTGSLRCSQGPSTGVTYIWDGSSLLPTNKGSSGDDEHGGCWNGVDVSWKDTQGKIIISHVFLPEVREYKSLLPIDESLDWKWTRHFLASKAQTGEWIMEGAVPEPIVMLVQQRRYWLAAEKQSGYSKSSSSSSSSSKSSAASGSARV